MAKSIIAYSKLWLRARGWMVRNLWYEKRWRDIWKFFDVEFLTLVKDFEDEIAEASGQF
jgi:hypothetical protein